LDESNIDPDNALEPITFTVTKVEGWGDPTSIDLSIPATEETKEEEGGQD
jgi:hypothetical protein